MTGGAECNVHPAIACQEDGPHVLDNPLPLSGSELGILFDRVLHLLRRQVMLRTECLGFYVGGRNAVFGQEILRALHPPFRKRLIVFG